MAMVKCRECAAPMSDEAAACPACGAPNRDQRRPTSWLVWATVAVAGVIGVLWAIGSTTPKYVAEARELRRVCERENVHLLAGNPDLCRKMERDLIELKGCPKDVPGCSWGGK